MTGSFNELRAYRTPGYTLNVAAVADGKAVYMGVAGIIANRPTTPTISRAKGKVKRIQFWSWRLECRAVRFGAKGSLARYGSHQHSLQKALRLDISERALQRSASTVIKGRPQPLDDFVAWQSETRGRDWPRDASSNIMLVTVGSIETNKEIHSYMSLQLDNRKGVIVFNPRLCLFLTITMALRHQA